MRACGALAWVFSSEAGFLSLSGVNKEAFMLDDPPLDGNWVEIRGRFDVGGNGGLRENADNASRRTLLTDAALVSVHRA